MSNNQQAYHREMRARSLDTILVHNPSKEDFIIENDKYGVEPQKKLIPHCKKDIGHGKGNAVLPRFLAERYVKTMIEAIITDIADKDWEEKKKNYRTLDETIQHADKVAIRTNDLKLWKDLTPKLWLGVVEKFGGLDLPEPPKKIIPDSGNPFKDAMKELGLEDREYEATTETI